MPSNGSKKGRQPYTADHYEAEIRKLYPEVQVLKAYVEGNPEDLETAKELEQEKETLRGYRDRWAERKEVIVYVANNEGLPNSSEELRYQTAKMPTYDAKKWPWRQVGDYIAYVPGIGWYPVCRERKTLADLDATLRDKDHRKNLYEEYERCLVDSRFTVFRFDLECTPEDLNDYLPPMPKTCKFCQVKRIKTDNGDYFCPKTFTIFPEKDPGSDFKCHEGFMEKKRDPVNVSAMKTLRKTIIRQCHEMGMQVVWRGSREAACEAYKPGVEEWLKLNYVRLLNLDVTACSDRAVLEARVAQLEAELQAARTSLLRYETPAEGVKA